MLESTAIVERPPKERAPRIRAAASNDLFNLPGVDGRSPSGRRYRDVVIALADDLGGADRLSESTKLLVRQAGALTVQVEALSARVLNGVDVDLEQLSRLQNALGRVLASLHRRTRRSLPSDRHDASPPAAAPDLSRLSNEELDRLHALLIEARSGEGSPS